MVEMGKSPTSYPLDFPGPLDLAQIVDRQVDMAIGESTEDVKACQVDLGGGLRSRFDESVPVHLEADRDAVGGGDQEHRSLHGTRKVAINVSTGQVD